MRFNATGDLTGGVGAGVELWVWPHLASHPQPMGYTGGSGGWYQDQPIAQIPSASNPDVWYCASFTNSSGTWTPHNLEGTTQGANWLYGGGNSWAGTRANPFLTRGVLGGQPFSGWSSAVRDCSPEGAIATTDGVVHWPDQSTTTIGEPFNPESIRVLGDLISYTTPDPCMRVIKRDGAPVSIRLLGARQWTPLAWVGTDASVWLWYYTTEYGVVLHRAGDSSEGYQFGETAYSMTVWTAPNGQTWLGYALRPGEWASDAVRTVKTLGEGMQPFVPVAPHAEPDPIVPQLAPAQVPFRLIVSDHPDNPPDDFQFGTWNRDDIRHLADRAAMLREPLILHSDGPSLPPGMIAACQQARSEGIDARLSWNCYPESHRPLSETQRDVEACFQQAAAAHLPIAPWIGLYRQIKTLTPPTYALRLPDVVEMAAWAWERCMAYRAGWIFVFQWSRAGGKDGIVAWPACQDLAAQMQAVQEAAGAPIVSDPTPTPSNPESRPVAPQKPQKSRPATDGDGTNGTVPEWVAVGIKFAKPLGRAIAWPFKKLFRK